MVSKFVQELASRLSVDLSPELGESGSGTAQYVRPNPARIKALGRILHAVTERDSVREGIDDEAGEYVSQTDRDPQDRENHATDSVKEAMLGGFRAGISVPVMMSIIENRKVYPGSSSHDEMFDSIISSIYRRLGPSFAEEKLIDIYARGPKAVLYVKENSKDTMAQVASSLQHLGKVFDLGYDESTGTYRIRLETEMDIGQRDLTKGKQTPRSTKDGTKVDQKTQDANAGTKQKLANQNKAHHSSGSYVTGKSNQLSGGELPESIAESFARAVGVTKVPALGDIWRKPKDEAAKDTARIGAELEKLITPNMWRSLPSVKKAAVLHTAYEKANIPVIPKHEFIQLCRKHKLLEFGFNQDDETGDDSAMMPPDDMGGDAASSRNPEDPPDLGGDGTDDAMGGFGGEGGGVSAGDKVKTPSGDAGIVIDPGVGGGDATVGVINFDVEQVPAAELELVGGGEDELGMEEPGPRDMETEPEAPEGEMGDEEETPDFGDEGGSEDDEDKEEKLALSRAMPQRREDYKDYMTTHALGDVSRYKDQHHEKDTGAPVRDRRGAEQTYGGEMKEDGTQTGTGSPSNATKGTGIDSHDTELDNKVNSLFDIEGEQFCSGTDTASDHSQKEPGDTANRSKDTSADTGKAYESVKRAKYILAHPDRIAESLTSANGTLKGLGFRPLSEVEYSHIMKLHAAGWLPDKIMDYVAMPREAIEAITNAETPEGANRGNAKKWQTNLDGDLTGY